MREEEVNTLLSTPMPPEPKKPRQEGLAYFGPQVEWADLLHRKLEALCHRQGIAWHEGSPNWRQLALDLARLYEPGFREATLGRPKSRDSVESQRARQNLLVVVECLASKTRKHPTKICDDLAKPSQRRKLPHSYQARTKLSPSTLKKDLALARRERQQEETRKEQKRRLHQMLRARRVGKGLAYSFLGSETPTK